jgi:hypothetical protein
LLFAVLPFSTFLLADNLVVELYVDALVAVPASVAKAILVELAQPLKLLGNVARGA